MDLDLDLGLVPDSDLGLVPDPVLGLWRVKWVPLRKCTQVPQKGRAGLEGTPSSKKESEKKGFEITT